MSRQAAVCVALADCHCVPLFFMGQGSAMMQLCNQVIGDIKDTEKYCSVMLNQTEVEHGKSTFFCFVCHFLGISAREKVRLGHSGKNWKMLNLFFQKNLIYGKTFFKNIPVLLMLPQVKGEIAHHEMPTLRCLPGNLKFLPYLHQTRDFQVSSLYVAQRLCNIKFHSIYF